MSLSIVSNEDNQKQCKNDKETLPYIKILIKQKSLNDSWDYNVNYLGGILSPSRRVMSSR